jgi:hypothetical protein
MDEKADAGTDFEKSSGSDIIPDRQDVDAEKIEDASAQVPEPPYTIFSTKARIFIIFMVSVSAMISPFAATSYYPALNTLAKELNVSTSLINLTITTYMVRLATTLAMTLIIVPSDLSSNSACRSC